ncbi:protein neprosin-like [Cannabis sativa]|uniref:protein neprosin-like n=1 Tax=Cannabis sativa TaxID=3483 RepID=UPI0029CA252E|nr:protein neprosin-like [Cannabis sativa]
MSLSSRNPKSHSSMAIRAIILISILCYISYYANAEETLSSSISKEEHLEIDEQLKQLNKSTVKTIQRDDGSIYDCVDFYKQPAFDHPLLKDHNYHHTMKPSSRPTKLNKNINENENKTNIEYEMVEIKGLGCPTGTVPVKRTTKEDLIRSKLFTKAFSSGVITPQTVEKQGLHHAVLQTKPGGKYNGGGVIMSLHGLATTIKPHYSVSHMTIKNGPDTIQVGWMVNPGLYGDSHTHAFIFSQAGGRSCFYTHCPGFVIVNTEIPLDQVYKLLSKRGEAVYVTQFFIYRDAINGNWWLEYGKDGTQIGFWPGRIFSSLNTGSNHVEWGGEAYTPPGQKPTRMGNGFRPRGDSRKDAFMDQITIIDESHKQVIAANTQKFIDNVHLYNVMDWGLKGSYGHVFSYGGPFISSF